MAKDNKDITTKDRPERRDAPAKDKDAAAAQTKDKRGGAPDAEQAAGAEKAAPRKKRERRVVPRGAAHIKASFNNTIISISDPFGTSSRGRRPALPAGRGRARARLRRTGLGENAARKAIDTGIEDRRGFVRGPGAGREAATPLRSRPPV